MQTKTFRVVVKNETYSKTWLAESKRLKTARQEKLRKENDYDFFLAFQSLENTIKINSKQA